MRIIITLLQAAGLGILGYISPRLLVAAGVPLDIWAQDLGAAIMISEDALLNTLGAMIAFILITTELWFHPLSRLFNRLRSKPITHDIEEKISPTQLLEPDILLIEPKHKYTLTWDSLKNLQIITRAILSDDEQEPLGTRLPIFRLKNIGNAVAKNVKINWKILDGSFHEKIKNSERLTKYNAKLFDDYLALKRQNKDGSTNGWYSYYTLNDFSEIKFITPDIDNVSYVDVKMPPKFCAALEMLFVACMPGYKHMVMTTPPTRAGYCVQLLATIEYLSNNEIIRVDFPISATAISTRPESNLELLIPIDGEMRQPPEIMADLNFEVLH